MSSKAISQDIRCFFSITIITLFTLAWICASIVVDVYIADTWKGYVDGYRKVTCKVVNNELMVIVNPNNTIDFANTVSQSVTANDRVGTCTCYYNPKPSKAYRQVVLTIDKKHGAKLTLLLVFVTIFIDLLVVTFACFLIAHIMNTYLSFYNIVCCADPPPKHTANINLFCLC